jgi:hypothetical protein
MSNHDYSELETMSTLSDEALWDIARSPLPTGREAKIFGLISNFFAPVRSQAQTQFTDAFRQMARKQEAVRVLRARGYEIKLRDLAAKRGQG